MCGGPVEVQLVVADRLLHLLDVDERAADYGDLPP